MRAGPRADISAYVTAIAAVGGAADAIFGAGPILGGGARGGGGSGWRGGWARALALLRQMSERDGLAPSESAVTAALAACGRAGRWRRAWQLYRQVAGASVVSVGSSVVVPQNSAPTDISLSGTTATAGAANVLVGNLGTTDSDAGDTHTYTIVSGTGFTISGSQL